MLLQGVCGKFLAHVRSVQHASRTVVDKRRPIDTPFFRMAENGIYTLSFQFRNELCLVIRLTYDGENDPFRFYSQQPVLDFLFGADEFFQHSFIADLLAEKGRLEGIADFVPVVIRGRIDQPVIFPSAYATLCFLHRHIEQGKKRPIFSHRLKSVLPVQCLDDIADLFLYVSGSHIHFLQGAFQTVCLPFSRMQSVLAFQFSGYLLASIEIVPVADAFPVLIHPDCDNMQMLPGNVGMLKDDIRLISETEFLQIFPGNILQVGIRQPVVGMRIEGDVHDRLFRAYSFRHIATEIFHGFSYVQIAASVVVNLVGGEQFKRLDKKAYSIVCSKPDDAIDAVVRLDEYKDHKFSAYFRPLDTQETECPAPIQIENMKKQRFFSIPL